MYFIATVAHETGEVNAEGNPKVVKAKYPVDAETIQEAVIRLDNFFHGETTGYSIIDIKKLIIECVIDPANRPELYGKKTEVTVNVRS